MALRSNNNSQSVPNWARLHSSSAECFCSNLTCRASERASEWEHCSCVPPLINGFLLDELPLRPLWISPAHAASASRATRAIKGQTPRSPARRCFLGAVAHVLRFTFPMIYFVLPGHLLRKVFKMQYGWGLTPCLFLFTAGVQRKTIYPFVNNRVPARLSSIELGIGMFRLF